MYNHIKIDIIKEKAMRTGVDIVEIKRIEKIIISKRESFLKKIFTDRERAYIMGKNYDPKTVSGMFASKEAVAKLIGSGIGDLAWKDIEVLHDKKGRPFVRQGEKIKKYLEELNLNSIEISISHEREYAISFAIGFLK